MDAMTASSSIVVTQMGRLRAHWPVLLLPLVALGTVGLLGRPIPQVLVILAVLLALAAPAEGVKIAAFALLAYGGYGLFKLHSLQIYESQGVRYGLVTASRGVIHFPGGYQLTSRSSGFAPMLAEAVGCIALGVCVLGVSGASGGRTVRRVLAQLRGGDGQQKAVPPLLLIPVIFLWEELFSGHLWFAGTVAMLLSAVIYVAGAALIAARPKVAAVIAVIGTVALGLYGVSWGLHWLTARDLTAHDAMGIGVAGRGHAGNTCRCDGAVAVRLVPAVRHAALQLPGTQIEAAVKASHGRCAVCIRGAIGAVGQLAEPGHRAHAQGTQIAIGTNNDLQTSQWTGMQWARQVVAPVRRAAAGYRSITVAGADDIEPGFHAGPARSKAWVTGFLSATKAPLVFNGSADGCSAIEPGSRCIRGWTAADLAWVAGLAAPKRVSALPQVYNVTMAQQWAMISLTAIQDGSRPLHFRGPLTENAACRGEKHCPTMGSTAAWQALSASLRSIGTALLPARTDLDVQ